MRRRSLLAAPAVLGLSVVRAQAQAPYPDRPLRMLVTIPPGGAPDVAARILSQRLGERLGQPVVIENRAGSNGQIATEAAVRSRPDGYTLLFAQDTVITVNPAIYERAPFNVSTDLIPIASVAANQFVLSVNPSLPVRNFEEFIALARRSNPPLAYASGGSGSQHQLAMEMLMRRAGIDMLHVPFRGGTPAVTATVAGDTVAVFSGTSSAPLIQQGRLRAIAVTGPQRSTAFPDLPRIGEIFPGYEVLIWLGVFAPAGTPAPVVAKLREEINASLAEPAVRGRLESAGGLEPLITTPAGFAELIRHDTEKYGALVREIGIKPE
ncbi:Bug family tripartite tricarboxylate transporter substrate binding protein [Muricoccus aerilatus]|uniref:Bug family tripartite tricarboxylate transporter substrate binding protein n=1 Tax=Muricoccus aerilatus TaxID=452982 RepID=UPI0005C1BAAE|nr:tripartite tricarboxylate transporter substrate binding protein [Roseomonas aerilata]